MDKNQNKLQPSYSKLGAWSYSIGTSIGWGSLVVTSNAYLSKAGPLGSTIGLIIGMFVMLAMARNYGYMINTFPDAGGSYAYVRDAFGYDRAFLVSWFLILTYIAMLWANATSLPLFAHYFFGDMFKFGYLFTILNYDIYLGEALLSIMAIMLLGLLAMRHKKTVNRIMIALAIIFTLGISFCFLFAMLRTKTDFKPLFAMNDSHFMQIVRIACISPWAFIGFENICHFSEEYTFSRKKIYSVLSIAVITTTLLYIFIMFLSVSAYPQGYANWYEYITHLSELSGINGLPPFHAAYYFLGDTGMFVLVLSLFALILSSLIGNIKALSRIFYTLAKDDILPSKFAELNDRNIPQNAHGLVISLSILIPFIGRTAIGWIVDVTTIGAIIIYSFISAATIKMAKEQKNKREMASGIFGLCMMLLFGVFIVVTNLMGIGEMEIETYILFVIWSVAGFIYFRSVLHRDTKKRFGRSIVVWIAFLALILFVSMLWLMESSNNATAETISNIQNFYSSNLNGPTIDAFINSELSTLKNTNITHLTMIMSLFAISLIMMLSNITVITKKLHHSELELLNIVEFANTDQMTGVKNKNAFSEMEQNINAQLANGDQENFAVIVCDVNGLKYVNDTFGHKAGDEYIKSASKMICDNFKHSPVYRIGGDEFVVIAKDQDYNNRVELVEQFNELSKKHIATNEVVVSAGVSEFDPSKDKVMHDVFERADALMYKKKMELKSFGAKTRD